MEAATSFEWQQQQSSMAAPEWVWEKKVNLERKVNWEIFQIPLQAQEMVHTLEGERYFFPDKVIFFCKSRVAGTEAM